MIRIAVQDERGFNQLYAPAGSTVFRAQRRTAWFIDQAGKIGAQRILELGCGTGETAAEVAKHLDVEVVAVDISDTFLERARTSHQAPNLRFEKFNLLGGDPRQLGHFDLVFGNGILHHLVPQLDAVLNALRAVGSAMAFIEPNFMNPYCALIFGTPFGRRRAHLEPDEMAFTAGKLRQALTKAGWSDVCVTTRDFLLPALPRAVVKSVLAVEPLLEATPLTRWLAQSHFVTARA